MKKEKEKKPEPIVQPNEPVNMSCTDRDCDDCGGHFHRYTCMDISIYVCVNPVCPSREKEAMKALNEGTYFKYPDINKMFPPKLYGESIFDSIAKMILKGFPPNTVGNISVTAEIEKKPNESIKDFHERANKVIQDKLRDHTKPKTPTGKDLDDFVFENYLDPNKIYFKRKKEETDAQLRERINKELNKNTDKDNSNKT